MALALPQVKADPAVQQALRRIAQQFPINGALIREETIERVHIVEKSLTGDLFVDGTITGTQIAAETIEAIHLHVTELSAITANMGTLTSGLITGAIIRTSSEGNRVVLDSAGLHAYKGVSTKVLDYDIETGALKLSGGTVEGGTVKGSTIEGVTIKASSKVEGGEIVGATFKTATSGARVEITGTSMKAINAAGKEKLNFDFTTGIIAVTAVISAEEGSEIPTKVLAGQIKETQIEEGAISTPKLQANSVTAAKMSVGELSAITANAGKLTAGEIQAGALSISTLSAISANLGSITAGTITGATFRTSGSNPKVVMDSEGFREYDSEGNVLTNIPANGTGITLTAASGEKEPPMARAIKWKEGATLHGAIIAGKGVGHFIQIMDGETRAGSHNYLETFFNSSTEEALITLLARGNFTTAHAVKLYLHSSPTTAENYASIDLGSNAVRLIDASEQSSFLQLPQIAKRKVLFGEITEGGAKFSGSEGWTCERVSTGLYRIKFSPALTSSPIVTFSVVGAVERIPLRVETHSTTEVTYYVVNTKFEVANAPTHFQIIG